MENRNQKCKQIDVKLITNRNSTTIYMQKIVIPQTLFMIVAFLVPLDIHARCHNCFHVCFHFHHYHFRQKNVEFDHGNFDLKRRLLPCFWADILLLTNVVLLELIRGLGWTFYGLILLIVSRWMPLHATFSASFSLICDTCDASLLAKMMMMMMMMKILHFCLTNNGAFYGFATPPPIVLTLLPPTMLFNRIGLIVIVITVFVLSNGGQISTT